MIAHRPRRVRHNALEELLCAIRVAAVQIGIAPARARAAREADAIPQTMIERLPGTVRSDAAKRARALMRALPDLVTDEERAEAAAALRGYAAIMDSPKGGEVVDEQWMGSRSHRRKLRAPGPAGRRA